jgi:hypothetical protein
VTDGEAVLHRRDDGEDVVAPGGLDGVGGFGDAGGDAVLGAAHGADGVEHGGGAGEGGGLGFGHALGRRHVGRKAAGAQAAAPHLGQVDAALAVEERVGAFGPGDVDMGVEGEQVAMDGGGELGRRVAGRRRGEDIVHVRTVCRWRAPVKPARWPGRSKPRLTRRDGRAIGGWLSP